MELLAWITQTIVWGFDFLLHLDRHLAGIIQHYGSGTYLILFAIVFCETGFVVTPFLPGDSLLFAAGAFSALPETGLSVTLVALLLLVAAILGDTVNYWIGKRIGPVVFERESRFIKRAHLVRTHRFFEKYGGKTIVLARFVPIVRTFAPFLAGVGTMDYPRFLLFNVTGAIAWISLFVGGGYFFGNLDFVRKNFTLVIMAIIVISVLPGVYEWWRARNDPDDDDAPASPAPPEARDAAPEGEDAARRDAAPALD